MFLLLNINGKILSIYQTMQKENLKNVWQKLETPIEYKYGERGKCPMKFNI